MTASGRDVGLANRLAGCPGEEHVRWLLDHSRPGAPRADGETLLRHMVVQDGVAETVAESLHRSTLGETAVTDVVGWSALDGDRVAVSYVAADDRRCELVLALGADGRVEVVTRQARDAEVEVTGHHTADLSEDLRAQLHEVFAAAYRDPDPGYLDDQLAHLQGIGIATERSGGVMGFTLYGRRDLDLPVIGRHGVGLPGLMCVRPGLRRKGVAQSCGNAAAAIALDGPIHLTVLKLATPATLRMVMRSIPVGRWPTADDPYALHLHPTSTQRAVLVELARAHGCEAGDGGVGIGRGRPIGTPIIEPEVSPEQAALFDRVDRSRGDTLLWVAWLTEPPEAWFD